MKDSNEYFYISKVYGNKKAKRSNLPLMNHIDEGLDILDILNASDESKRAFCIHSIFQFENLIEYRNDYLKMTTDEDFVIVGLARKYSVLANRFLCKPETDNWDKPEIVKQLISANGGYIISADISKMLLADKTQNYKDFMLHHYGVHERSHELFNYFNLWIDVLNPRAVNLTILNNWLETSGVLPFPSATE